MNSEELEREAEEWLEEQGTLIRTLDKACGDFNVALKALARSYGKGAGLVELLLEELKGREPRGPQ